MNVRIENGNIVIEVMSEDVLKHFRPDTVVVREIMSHVRNKGIRLNNLVIIIENNFNGKSKHIARVKHNITLDVYRRWSQTIEYVDGRKDFTPSRTFY